MATERKIFASDGPIRFESPEAWAKWLAAHCATSSGVWLRLAKKGADQRSISYAEALEVALCYGWIDGQKKSDSQHHWLQRFTPRSARSLWSKINREKALKLIQEGRMKAAGLEEIQRAKRDGRWAGAYDSSSGATVPPDLQAALDANARAKSFFATLDARNRYAILFRLQTAKKAETRAKRLQQFVDMLSRHEKLHP
jgi:uncharacterized protein YdeI (YjbR/CyaY-like superfamily)